MVERVQAWASAPGDDVLPATAAARGPFCSITSTPVATRGHDGGALHGPAADAAPGAGRRYARQGGEDHDQRCQSYSWQERWPRGIRPSYGCCPVLARSSASGSRWGASVIPRLPRPPSLPALRSAQGRDALLPACAVDHVTSSASNAHTAATGPSQASPAHCSNAPPNMAPIEMPA